MNFDTESFVKVVNEYLRLDEVERALWLLDNLPAKARDFPPMELIKLKQDILGAIVTPHAYQSCDLDSQIQPDSVNVQHLNRYLRGILVQEEVKRFNDLGLTPHIVDVGPGEYFVPLGLQTMGYRFTYWDIGMDKKTSQVAHPRLSQVRMEPIHSNQPVIFLALEIMEHLPEPRDLLTECLRHCGRLPERVHFSTPMYCFDENPKAWNKPCGLPHLRTYTPGEFMETVQKLFKGYQWELYQSECMSLRGCHSDRIDTILVSEEQFKQMGEARHG